MKFLATIAREAIGLFVDDGALALGIAVVVALAGICEFIIPDARVMGGVTLIIGCLAVLFMSVLRAGGDRSI